MDGGVRLPGPQRPQSIGHAVLPCVPGRAALRLVPPSSVPGTARGWRPASRSSGTAIPLRPREACLAQRRAMVHGRLRAGNRGICVCHAGGSRVRPSQSEGQGLPQAASAGGGLRSRCGGGPGPPKRSASGGSPRAARQPGEDFRRGADRAAGRAGHRDAARSAQPRSADRRGTAARDHPAGGVSRRAPRAAGCRIAMDFRPRAAGAGPGASGLLRRGRRQDAGRGGAGQGAVPCP